MAGDGETEILKGKDQDHWVGVSRMVNGREVWWGKWFVHYGKKYIVIKSGQTVCAGRVV